MFCLKSVAVLSVSSACKKAATSAAGRRVLPSVSTAPALSQAQWMHTDPGLSLTYKDEVAIIKMDNKKDNRVSTQFLKDFSAQLDEVEGNTSCKALISTGEGKFYSNGLDTDWMATISGEELIEFLKEFQRLLLRLILFPLPTLAMLNGHTFAGGALLAFSHDLRTMNSDKGWVCLNEVMLYKRFGPFMISFLRNKLGSGRTFSDTCLARRFTAQEALTSHVIHTHAPLPSLLDESVALLRSFYGTQGYPRSSLGPTKRDIYADLIQVLSEEEKDPRPYVAVQFLTEEQRASLGL